MFTMKRRRTHFRTPIALLACAGSVLAFGATPFAKYEGTGGDSGGGSAGNAGGSAGNAGSGSAGGSNGNAGATGGSGSNAGGSADEVARIKAALAERESQLAAINLEIAELRKTGQLSAAQRAELEELKKQREAAEEKRKREEGQFELLLKDKTDNFARELAERDGEIKRWRETVCQERTMNRVSSEIVKHTDVPVDDVYRAVFSGVVYIDENGKEIIKDPAINGQHPKNEHGRPMTIAEYVKHAISQKPWLKRASTTNGSGGGSNRSDSNGIGGDEDVSLSDMTDTQWSEFKKKTGLDKVGKA